MATRTVVASVLRPQVRGPAALDLQKSRKIDAPVTRPAVVGAADLTLFEQQGIYADVRRPGVVGAADMERISDEAYPEWRYVSDSALLGANDSTPGPGDTIALACEEAREVVFIEYKGRSKVYIAGRFSVPGRPMSITSIKGEGPNDGTLFVVCEEFEDPDGNPRILAYDMTFDGDLLNEVEMPRGTQTRWVWGPEDVRDGAEFIVTTRAPGTIDIREATPAMALIAEQDTGLHLPRAVDVQRNRDKDRPFPLLINGLRARVWDILIVDHTGARGELLEYREILGLDREALAEGQTLQENEVATTEPNGEVAVGPEGKISSDGTWAITSEYEYDGFGSRNGIVHVWGIELETNTVSYLHAIEPPVGVDGWPTTRVNFASAIVIDDEHDLVFFGGPDGTTPGIAVYRHDPETHYLTYWKTLTWQAYDDLPTTSSGGGANTYRARFGDISQDGRTLAIGCCKIGYNGSDGVYTFGGAVLILNSTDGWETFTPGATVQPSDLELWDAFGICRLTPDGRALAVGSRFRKSSTGGLGAGGGYVFFSNDRFNTIESEFPVEPPDGLQGGSDPGANWQGDRWCSRVAVSRNKEYFFAGAQFHVSVGTDAGTMWVHRINRDTGQYELEHELQPDNLSEGDEYGTTVAVNRYGNRFAVASRKDVEELNRGGAVYVWEGNAGQWVNLGIVEPPVDQEDQQMGQILDWASGFDRLFISSRFGTLPPNTGDEGWVGTLGLAVARRDVRMVERFDAPQVEGPLHLTSRKQVVYPVGYEDNSREMDYRLLSVERYEQIQLWEDTAAYARKDVRGLGLNRATAYDNPAQDTEATDYLFTHTDRPGEDEPGISQPVWNPRRNGWRIPAGWLLIEGDVARVSRYYQYRSEIPHQMFSAAKRPAVVGSADLELGRGT